MNNIERIACYIRVSSQEQKLHGISLDAQRDTLKRYAEAHGLLIVEWYEDEGISGRKLIRKRPALQRMLNDAKEGKFDRIIFIKLDRYFRSVAEYYECQKILDIHKVTWTATEERYDLTTASGRYWVTQKLAMAEYEADNTGERIKLVNEYKIRTGQPLTGSQNQGIAYTVERDSEGIKRVVKDKSTKDLVMDYINHFLIHQNKKQAYLYVKDKYNANIGYSIMGKVLKDTKIYGYYRGNPNYCEPYISEDTWNEIQSILNKNIRTNSTNHVYLFSGLILCPHCRTVMGGGYNSSQRKSIKNKTYFYSNEYFSYRCRKHAKDVSCDYNKRPNEARIEKELLNRFNSFMIGYIEATEQEAIEIETSHTADVIKEIKGEITRLNNMYKKGRIEEKEYDRDFEELTERLEKAEKTMKPIEKRALTRYKELISDNWKEMYNKLTKENKRAFWRHYIKAINLDDNTNIKDIVFF